MAKEKYRKRVLEYEDVRIAVEDNHKIGFAEGLEKGMEKGREEGRQRLLETARKLLSKCMTINEVAEITGLNLEEPHLHE